MNTTHRGMSVTNPGLAFAALLACVAGCSGTSGSDNTGGQSSLEGGSSSVGGNSATVGGEVSTGGQSSIVLNTGGSISTGGAASDTGGTVSVANTGGAAPAGGAQNTGGNALTGGAANTGGASALTTGGTSASATTGGASSAGGATAQSSAKYGNPNGHCSIPAEGQPADTSSPDHVVGTGTPASCTSEAFVGAVAQGGVITFNCGSDPVTIAMTDTAKIYNKVNNANNQKVVIDGGGLVTLDGGGARRILYQNTCDEALIWATSRCDQQNFPNLVVQNIAFANGLGASSQVDDGGLNGGGALYVNGGTFKAYNVKITDSAETHPSGQLAQDLAGGGIYAFELMAPAYIVNSTFVGNSASNGGAIGGLFISYTIVNSVFSANAATGHGMNPAQSGTTGGGLGGAIYNDGNSYTLSICGTAFDNNTANDLGSGSIFMVANDLKGTLSIDQSTFTGNSNNGSVQSNASIYVEAKDKAGNAGVSITNTTFN